MQGAEHLRRTVVFVTFRHENHRLSAQIRLKRGTRLQKRRLVQNRAQRIAAAVLLKERAEAQAVRQNADMRAGRQLDDGGDALRRQTQGDFCNFVCASGHFRELGCMFRRCDDHIAVRSEPFRVLARPVEQDRMQPDALECAELLAKLRQDLGIALDQRRAELRPLLTPQAKALREERFHLRVGKTERVQPLQKLVGGERRRLLRALRLRRAIARLALALRQSRPIQLKLRHSSAPKPQDTPSGPSRTGWCPGCQ